MRISKTRKVKTPTRGTSRSAGLDFYVPDDWVPSGDGTENKDFTDFIMAANGAEGISHEVQPGSAIRIDSGIKVEVPAGYALIAFNKSGIALSGLQIGACVVDEDYQGVINLHLFNVSDKPIRIKQGQKLAQFILLPVLYHDVEVVPEGELHAVPTERGDGAFGSTNHK